MSSDPLIGSNLGKYEIRALLGKGGMGAVYRAFDPIIEREVAIKVLAESFAADPVSLKRFVSEARATGKLNHHNTIAIFDIGQSNAIHYLVMELATGGSVSERLIKGPRLPVADACRIIAEAGEGLSAAHRMGLIHRDIKPENLMLTEDQTVKIVDFGLSKAADSGPDAQTVVTLAGQIVGTPHYMSPEQFTGAPLDERTDIYSLGITLYVLLTSQLPFRSATSVHQIMYAHLQTECPDPRLLRRDLPEECSRIVAKATAKAPADRYADVRELVADLRPLCGGAPAPATDSSATRTAHATANVLIVEPSKFQAAILRDALLKAGAATVNVAAGGKEALAQLAATVPNVLIAARHLPDIDGDHLIGQLQSNPALRETMCIVTSSDLRLQEVIDVVGRTTRGFVAKNSRPDEILRAITVATDIDFPAAAFAARPAAVERRVLLVDSAPTVLPELARTLRSAGALNLDVLSYAGFLAADAARTHCDLLLCVRHPSLHTASAAAAAQHSEAEFAQLLERFETSETSSEGTLAVLDERAGKFTLQCVRRSGFNVSCACRFDEARFARLMRIL